MSEFSVLIQQQQAQPEMDLSNAALTVDKMDYKGLEPYAINSEQISLYSDVAAASVAKNFQEINASLSSQMQDILSADMHFLMLWAQVCGILLVTSMTLGGNAVVILTIVCTGGHRKATNCLIMCLAAADLIIGLLFPVSVGTFLVGEWPWSSASCQVFSFVSNVCLDASMMATLFITLDRWWSIYKPFVYRTTQSRRRSLAGTLSAWLCGAVIYGVAFLIWNTWVSPSPSEHCTAPFSKNIAFTFTVSMLEFIIPTLLVLYCNFSVYRKIQSRKNTNVRRSISSTSDHISSCLSTYVDEIGVTGGIPRGRRSPRRGSLMYTDLELARARRHSLYKSSPSPTRSLDAGTREPQIHNEKDTLLFADKRRLFTGHRRVSFDAIMTEHFRRFRRQSSGMLISSNTAIRKDSDALVKEMLQKQNKKAARALALLVSVFLICWCPYTLIKALNPLVPGIPMIVIRASEWICYFNSTLNPLLHILGNASFTRRLRHFLGIERKPITLIQMAKRTTKMTDQQQAFVKNFARRPSPPSSNGLVVSGNIPEDIPENEATD